MSAADVVLSVRLDVDGDREYVTDDGFVVSRVSGRRPWLVFPPWGYGSRRAENLDGAKWIISRLRTDRADGLL
jgi:hypothetical protein